MNLKKAAILSLVCSPLLSHATVMDIKGVDQLNNQVLNAGKPAIIKVGATWCPACVRSKSPFEKISNDGQFADVLFVEVDADASPDIVQKYNVQSLPTFIYVNNGAVVDTKTGFSENLKNDISSAVTRMKGTQAPASVEKKTEEAGQLQETAPASAAAPEAEGSGTCAAMPTDSLLGRAYNAVRDFFVSIGDTIRGWFR